VDDAVCKLQSYVGGFMLKNVTVKDVKWTPFLSKELERHLEKVSELEPRAGDFSLTIQPESKRKGNFIVVSKINYAGQELVAKTVNRSVKAGLQKTHKSILRQLTKAKKQKAKHRRQDSPVFWKFANNY
jgi:ribosome-associated translation inhibitor RaiA